MKEDTGTGGHKTALPEFCRAMVDASPMPMTFLSGNEHIIRYANEAFCQLIGAPGAGLVNRLFSEAVPESDACLALLDRVHRSGKAETHTGQDGDASHRFYWSYAMWPVLSAVGARVGTMVEVIETTRFHKQTIAVNEALVIGSVRQHELAEAADRMNAQLHQEIIQRARAEEELKISERQFRGLIEAIPQIVWTALPDGTLDFANSKWFECFGVDLDTFNRSGWSMLLHPDDMERTLEAWAKGLGTLSPFQFEHRFRTAGSDAWRWYFTRAIPILAEPDGVTKWFGTSTDIDDRKRSELAGFAEQKLESLGVLAGGIAHDFNNLLCVILGGASLLKSAVPKSHSLHQTIGDTASAGERAAHLTRQMLAYAGKGRFLVQPTDMNEVVQSTCQLCRASLPGSVRLTVQTRPGLPLVQADAGQMQQVVMNLVQNAAESIDAGGGGSVIVKTALADLTEQAILNSDLLTGTLSAGSYVAVEVTDDGSGMDHATRARILDPFFTTKFTGRGLGLSAVGGILRGQGGALELRTAAGRGSTFRAYLPAAPVAMQPPAVSVEARPARGERTILVVDDEEMVRRIARRSLENGGFTVLLASGGIEALAILQSEIASSISLIILDLSMPEMSGRQLMEAIRHLGIDIPILICSGYSEAEVSREFFGLEISGFVPKPFTIKQLENRVHGALNPGRPQ